ncbi:hypothetical protein FGD71_011960 [Streptomyces sporangiiformans]|uniref:Uncharacterized protein n=1 Tax=Streptomyces sporangiiformans TaxID=2315329 RepID=A0A505DM97_9ACTN|nr:hypothetical protein FGD71_011960 [Streptomyces sporangiiformans]
MANSRKRAAHPAARPTVQLPQDEWLTRPPADELPAVCGKFGITVPADAAGDLKTAKFRQDSHYLTDDWIAVHKPIRSHNEGIHGRLKSDELDIGNPKHRQARGQVAQTLLVALMATAGNLDILETWLYQRTGTQLTDTDYTDTIPHQPAQTEKSPPVGIGRPPAHRHPTHGHRLHGHHPPPTRTDREIPARRDRTAASNHRMSPHTKNNPNTRSRPAP